MKKPALLWAVLIALAILFTNAACAGGEGDTQATPTPIFQGEFSLEDFAPAATMLPPTKEPDATLSEGQVAVIQDGEGRQIAIQYFGFPHGFSCMSNNPLYVNLSEEEMSREDPFNCFAADYSGSDEFNWDGPVVARADGGQIWLEKGWSVVKIYNPALP